MLILILFSFLAGIATVLSPCVLPVLPALLSAGGGQGRLRPLGIITGVIVSFTFFTLALTSLVYFTGISPDFLRYLAIAIIALFGFSLIFPTLGEKFARATAGVADFGQALEEQSRGISSKFWSGFVLGSALGLVWTPCAGPILAAITTLVATSSLSFFTFILTLSYSLGAALPMFLIIYGGNKLVTSKKFLSSHAETIRKGFGVLMVLAALMMAFHYDTKLQEIAIQYVPLITIEDNQVVREELDKLRNPKNSKFILPPQQAKTLPRMVAIPELVGITGWVNSDPLTLTDLRGKVVLIDFWTYSCINCIRTFPYLKSWYDKYKDKGFTIIGVHTPEFEFEKNPANIKEAVKRFELTYPIAIDSKYQTWQNFNNRYWPAHYLVDQQGFLRSYHFGEGAYMETENDIRNLLGLPPLKEKEIIASTRAITRETYLGYERGDKYARDKFGQGIVLHPNVNAFYDYRGTVKNDEVALRGHFLVSAEKITTEGSGELDLNFLAPRVYLVMEADQSKAVTVLLDGKPLDGKYYTSDMNMEGKITVKEPRKYDVINLHGQYERHKLTLQIPKGVSLYAFTFGDEP